MHWGDFVPRTQPAAPGGAVSISNYASCPLNELSASNCSQDQEAAQAGQADAAQATIVLGQGVNDRPTARLLNCQRQGMAFPGVKQHVGDGLGGRHRQFPMTEVQRLSAFFHFLIRRPR